MKISNLFMIPIIQLLSVDSNPKSMVNINHRDNAVFNGTQINNYSEKKILDLIEEILNRRS